MGTGIWPTGSDGAHDEKTRIRQINNPSLRQRKDNFHSMHYCPVKRKMDRKMTIEDLLEKHPGAVTVFLKRMMLCVGCPTSGFHTLEDAARLYGFRLDELCREVDEAIHCAEKRSRETCEEVAIC